MLSDPMIPLDAMVTLADGLDHPEGVTWGPDGYLYAGGEAGEVYRVSLETGALEQIGSTEGFLLGVVTDGDANVYGCDQTKQAVMRTSQKGDTTVYSSGSPDRAMICPNAGVFAADGTLYVSDSGNWRAENGCIWMIRPGGETELLSDEVRAHSNGIAIHPVDGSLYCVESLRPAIMRVPLGADGRASGPAEVVLPLTPEIIADGIAFANDGSLLIACYTPDVIYRLSADRKLTVLAYDPHRVTLAAPTNVAFAGPALTSLVVSSLGRWHLTRMELDEPGAPLNYPKLG